MVLVSLARVASALWSVGIGLPRWFARGPSGPCVAQVAATTERWRNRPGGQVRRCQNVRIMLPKRKLEPHSRKRAVTWRVARAQILPNLKCEKPGVRTVQDGGCCQNANLKPPFTPRSVPPCVACRATRTDQLMAPSKPPEPFQNNSTCSEQRPHGVCQAHPFSSPQLRARRRMRAPKQTANSIAPHPRPPFSRPPFSSCRTTTPSGLPQTKGNNESGTPYFVTSFGSENAKLHFLHDRNAEKCRSLSCGGRNVIRK